MSARHPAVCAGSPTVLCQSYDVAVNLPALVDAVQTKHETLVWLDSARVHRLTGRYSVLGWDPWLTFSASGESLTLTTSTSTTSWIAHPLKALREVLARYPGPRHADLPPIGVGWLGWFGYDLNRWIERVPAPKPADIDLPDLRLYGMRMLMVVDHLESRSWCVSLVDPHQPPDHAQREARLRLEAFEALRETLPDPGPGSTPVGSQGAPAIEPAMSPAAFETMVHRAKQYIEQGDIFQANLSQRFSAAWSGSPRALYLALRAINPSPFACFVTCPEGAIVSCSPERLIQVHEGWASTRPIAGTRPRGATQEEDLVNSLELILSDKERAEHIMLVDLERNDLGRVCRYGSVAADEVMILEDYSHVIHIVSNIRGRLKAGVDAADVIRAMFPGGTITGCPKVRCMEILQELEPVGRGLYTGSVGYLGFDGTLDLNLLIRTIFVQPARLSFHVGAGIVADSQPDREYEETLAKAQALLKAIRFVGDPLTSDAVSR